MRLRIILLCLSLSAAYADLNIVWENSTQPVYLGHNGGPFVSDGSLALLVWSQAGMIDALGPYNFSGGIISGEYILDSTTTGGGYGLWNGSLGNAGGGLFSNADVGGNDIHSGYFYTRIFNNPSGSAYDHPFNITPNYVDANEVHASSYVFNSLDPLSAYSENALAGPAIIPAIPEPSTIGLMGIAGIGVLLVRKKTRSSIRTKCQPRPHTSTALPEVSVWTETF